MRDAFYNENDAYAAQWLRNLITAGHIAPGVVDERSIIDIEPDELRGYTQCHFFAGLGAWSYALRLAGWTDDRFIWTGSCPCQPFSAAGAGKGHEDERHLWPAWFRLIGECRPAVVFGEQVASADGRAWLDVVLSDLENDSYAVGAADIPAAGIGAPHIRQRLFFVADANSEGSGRYAGRPSSQGRAGASPWSVDREYAAISAQSGGDAGVLADAEGWRRRQGCADAPRRDEGVRPQGAGLRPADDGCCGLGDTSGARSPQQRRGRIESARPAEAGFWGAADWLPCRDGKARPVEPGTFPLATGIANRVGRLRAYGNSLCAPAAAVVIRAAMESSHA